MAKSKIQSIVDYFFSYPGVSNFIRFILEASFKQTKRTIKRELNCNKKTLDIGCGNGLFSVFFKDYIGIDTSSRFIKYAQKKYNRKFLLMNALKLKFPKNSFDNVLIIGVLHHLNNNEFIRVVSEIKGVLKDNGRVLIIEDIPAESCFNILGKLARKFDSGSYIREIEDYQKLLKKELFLKKIYKIKNGIADYGVFILTKN